MLRKLFKTFARLVFYLTLGGVGILVLSRLLTGLVGWVRTYSEAEVPARPVAIVFGAGLTRNGDASVVLRDRIQTAANLYLAGKVEKLLMTGDNSTLDYNEPAAMRAYALSLGIPDEDIVLDYAGRRTYDTCYRARYIFGVQQAILVTQQFHLPRAIFTCNNLGIEAVGVIADQRRYSQYAHRFWRFREIPATAMAFIEVFITRPLPVLGEPEPIFGLSDESSSQEQSHQ